MDGYQEFEDQIDAYFTRYEGFRVTFRILQISEENDRGVILAEFQTESDPRGGGRSSRREGQLRFELERGAKGWKIVDLNPRGFFS
jgi:ketosteroid isomerase-like protein